MKERRTLGQIGPDELKAVNDLQMARVSADATLQTAMQHHSRQVGGIIAATNAFWQDIKTRMPSLPETYHIDFATGELYDEVEVP